MRLNAGWGKYRIVRLRRSIPLFSTCFAGANERKCRSRLINPIMKKFVYLLALFVFVGAMPAEAQRNNQNQAAQRARAEKEKQRKEEKAKRERINSAIEDLLDGRDKNKDKSLTLEEYLSGESDAKSGEENFKEHNKNRDRYLSRTEMQELLGL